MFGWTNRKCSFASIGQVRSVRLRNPVKKQFFENNTNSLDAYVGGTSVVDPSCRVHGERVTFIGYNLHAIQSSVTNSNKLSAEPCVRGPSTFAKTHTNAYRRRTMCTQRPKTWFAAGHFEKNIKISA